ncbi:MAG: MBL fold metallo-hydrolase [Salinivirgaceae bacterium]
MNIVSLIDNYQGNERLKSEHGLCLYIETAHHKILFDTGQSDLFIENAKKMNIDLSEVDTVVISHAHNDHIGGLIHFLEINQKAKIYLKREIFDNRYYSIKKETKRFIGFPSELLEHKNRFEFVESAFFLLGNQIFITKVDFNYAKPKGNKLLFKEQNSIFTVDDFAHEQIFAMRSKGGLTVFGGCAHNGILNVLSTVNRFLPDEKVIAVIGGFHLIDPNEFTRNETVEELQFIGNELLRVAPEASFYTGHCTGIRSLKILAEVMGNKIQKLETGLQIVD